MSHDTLDLNQYLNQRGYRMTQQRQLVLDVVCAQGIHLAAKDIFQAVTAQAPDLSRATVYRALDFWCELGLIATTPDVNGQLVYQIFQHDPHHHLVCRACGRSIEIPQEALEPLSQQLMGDYGFAVDPHAHATFFGYCAHCTAQQGVQHAAN